MDRSLATDSVKASSQRRINWQGRYADCVESMASAAALGNILNLAEKPNIISFGGGLPDPKTFLLEELRELADLVLREQGGEALNYGPSLGYTSLREWIAARMGTIENVQASIDDIIVTSGGLEAINLIAGALLNPGDRVLVAAPTYLAAIHTFQVHRARILSIPCDQGGISAEGLEARLEDLDKLGTSPGFLYVIPTFQNPSGLTLSLERRKRIVDICRRFEVPILEDHAYAELRYGGDRIPTLKELAPESVIFVHTFSKIFGPGVRLGWVVADPSVINTLCLFKMGGDQCSNSLTQRLVFEAGKRGLVDLQVSRAIPLYRRKRDLLLRELERRLQGRVSWTRPEGGFYCWVRLPPGSDGGKLLETAIQQYNVAFVAGSPFFVNHQGQENLRLSFSFINEGLIPEGVRRLAKILEK